MKKKLLIILAILSMTLLVACGGKNNKGNTAEENAGNEGKNAAAAEEITGSKVDEIKAAGKLVLGTSADYPPMEWIMYEGSEEKFVGLDIEIAKVIAEELGVELEIKNMAFEGLLNSLNAGDLDIVLAGMVASPERKEAVDFSDPYYSGGQVLLVRAGEEGEYDTVADLKGKKIGAQLGTIQHQYAEKEFGADVTGMDVNNNLILELKNKTLDCLFLAELPAKQFAAVDDALVVVEDIGVPNEDGNAIAVKKGNEDLVAVCNKVVKDLQDQDQIKKWLDEFIKLSVESVEENK